MRSKTPPGAPEGSILGPRTKDLASRGPRNLRSRGTLPPTKRNLVMDVTKPCKFIKFGAMDVTKPCKFIGFGAMDVTKPYKFIGFGAMEILYVGRRCMCRRSADVAVIQTLRSSSGDRLSPFGVALGPAWGPKVPKPFRARARRAPNDPQRTTGIPKITVSGFGPKAGSNQTQNIRHGTHRPAHNDSERF